MSGKLEIASASADGLVQCDQKDLCCVPIVRPCSLVERVARIDESSAGMTMVVKPRLVRRRRGGLQGACTVMSGIAARRYLQSPSVV